MKNLMFLLMMLGNISLLSQAVFILESIPEATPEQDFIFMTGGFNGWNPGDINHRLYKNTDGLWETILDGFPNGIELEYKFTRGSWQTVEKGPSGEEIPNRVFAFGNGDTVYITIDNWADQAPGTSTAAENVYIMDEAFWMPQLSRNRTIWIYLPPDYDDSNEKYPVLYMHDAQNLFDEKTSFAGEWEVDETLNELAGEGYNVPIVVGINHGGAERINELTPWIHPSYGGGQGDEYLAFIVETLKPYVDSNYRTLPDQENTGIMGSSLGGLISCYGALKYPDVFSKSGPYSPAYWINEDSLFLYVSALMLEHDVSYYQAIGGDEPSTAIQLMNDMEDSLNTLGFNQTLSTVIPGAGHNEACWRNDFANAYLWLFSDYAFGIEEHATTKPIHVYPNPTTASLTLMNFDLLDDDIIQILGDTGKLLREYVGTKTIQVDDLPKGSYFIRISREGKVYLVKFIKL